MKSMIIGIFSLFIILAFVSGCSNANAFDVTRAENDPDVYVAGMDWSSGFNKACYWKNGELFFLDDEGASDSDAQSIAVNGRTVYICGNRAGDACYWVDGAIHDLDGNYAHSIFFANSTLYIAGSGPAGSCYWEGPTRNNLTADADAFGIFVVPGQIYICGYQNSASEPIVWRNGVESPTIGGGAFSHALGIAGTAVADSWRAVGFYNGGSPTACYWTTSGPTDLPGATSPSTAQAITIADGVYYTCGGYTKGSTYQAAYWRGDQKVDLPGGAPSGAYSIAVVQGRVYVAGWYTGGTGTACYWVDGQLVPLEDGLNGWAKSIAVVVKN